MTDSCELTYQYRGSSVIATCVTCPEQPAIAASPQQVLTDPRLGWNSAARSAVALSGDCYTQFTFQNPLIGSICGLSTTYIDTDPSTVHYGIYGFTDGGRGFYAIMERGEVVVASAAIDLATAVFRVARSRARVSYFVNGQRVYTSQRAEAGSLMVVALMYSANDGVL